MKVFEFQSEIYKLTQEKEKNSLIKVKGLDYELLEMDFLEKKILENLKIGIIISTFYKNLSSDYLNEFLKKLNLLKVPTKNLKVYEVPGTFEIPWFLKKIHEENKDLDVILCLGILIKGTTQSFEHISREVTRSLACFNEKSKFPCVSGILSAQNQEEVLERIFGKKEKLSHLVLTCLKMGYLNKINFS